uniref:Tail assembly chaperone protein n=1 Tax=Siphoviridae sp. ctSqu13 TaxID=2825513 RepID=A0A8S5PGZ4_9CAUD|nr:MAG TPA: tail assembly chaperone protein [Siphoviridae sp. ctSqu13]
MEFKVKNKVVEIKFDYRTMFKVDKQLATKNKETGASNNDGVGTLFNNILNHNDQGLVDLIVLAGKSVLGKAITEDDAITAIENWLVENEADDTKKLFEEIKEEMIESGFFKNKILKYIKGMQKALEYLKAKDNVDAIEVQAVKDMILEMQNALS